MEIIFHSDDMGMTPNVTRNLLKAWDQNLINSFSILANGDGLEIMSLYLKENETKQARIAVHLNLSEGLSSLNYKELSLITTPDGYLNCSFIGLLIKWFLYSKQKKTILLEQIEKEWKAQIEKIQEICSPRKINALDSHTHIHMLPFIFPIVIKLSKLYNIPEIRITREIFHIKSLFDLLSPSWNINLIKHLLLNLLSIIVKTNMTFDTIQQPEAMIGILYTGNMTLKAAKAGINVSQKNNIKKLEVLFHVGRALQSESERWALNKSFARFPLSEHRDREFNELMNLRKDYP